MIRSTNGLSSILLVFTVFNVLVTVYNVLGVIIVSLEKEGKYRIKGRKRLHTASVPGESWANLTGKARKGIDFLVKGSSEFHFINDVKYAGYLEFGTTKMEPRPAHLIAIEENDRNIVNTLGDALDNAYNGVIK